MNDIFKIRIYNQRGIMQAELVAEYFEILLERLDAICPRGKSFDKMLDYLEAASMHAKKSIGEAQVNCAREGQYDR